MPKLDDLELKIKQTTDSVDGITKMSNALKRLATNANGLGGIGDSIKKMSDALRHFPNDSAKSVKDFATAMVKLKNTSQYASAIGSSIRQVTRALNDMINAIDVDKLTAIADAMNKIQDASKFARVSTAIKAATKSASGSSSMGDTEATTEVAEGMDEVTEATSEATQSVYTFKDALRDIGSNAKEGLSVVWGGLKKIGSAALTAGKHLLSMGWDRLKSKVNGLIKPIGNLVSSFGRIAMYRALRTAIKAITTGFAEGTKHLYEWSTLVGDNFKNSMDSLATSAHYLRDSLGAMASPLLDALAPAIEVLVEKFVNLLNVVNQFIATFTGKDTWRKAVRTPTTYGDAMKQAADNTRKATKAQKELNKSLQGFDELNVITTNDIKGRTPTASGGADTPEVSTTEFVTVPVADWIQEIKNAIENGDWSGAGKMLATKLNGLISDFKAEEWGKKLGKKIENGLKFYNSFMEGMDWGQLGIKAATFINGLLSEIDPQDLGDALTQKISAGLKFLKNFAWTLDVSSLGTALGTAFNNLFSPTMMEDLGLTISGFINDAIDVGAAFIATADLGEAGYNIVDGIVTSITTIDWAEAGSFLADVATGLIDFLLGALEAAIDNLDDIMAAVMEFVDAFFTKLGDYFHEKFFSWADDVNEWFAGVFNTDGAKGSSVSDSLIGDFGDPIQGAKDLKNALDDLDGTTATVGAKDKDNSLTTTDNKAKTLNKDINKTEGTRKAKFTLDGVEASKTKVNNYLKKLNTVRGNFKANIETSGYKTSLKEIQTLQSSLDKLSEGKYKMVIDVVGGGTSDAKVVVNNYMGTGLQAYAEGGYPEVGSLFVAGETGPEFVSTINGRTGVASGAEITGIADAVYNTGDTEANLLREQNRLLRQILAKNMSVTLAPSAAAGKWVSQSQAAYAKASG